MKFEAVIFDLFGTLVDDFVSSVGPVHIDMADALEVPYDQFTPLWNQTLEMRIVGAFETVEANIEYVCNTMNLRPAAEQIRKAVEIRMSSIKHALQPRPDAVSTLTQLKNQGYKIGLISNASIEIPILWQETAFANLIETPIFSSRAHLRKPDLRIYNLACERLVVRPESCLYIGDGEDYELKGAAEIGLNPVLIRTSSRPGSGSHQEAGEWQGVAVANLAEVLELVRD
ncbi:MAG: HAD family hydrolase [Candidatus Binatia bacterium]